MSATQTAPTTTESLSLQAEGLEQWEIDLQRDGFAVVKGAVPRERAEACAESMFQWLESL